MFKKAQGLPINFIVLAALAILILILGAGFVIAGGSSFTRAMAPQQFESTCQSLCGKIQTQAAALSSDDANAEKYYQLGGQNHAYCTAQETQEGTKFCINGTAQRCYITFSDGIQKQVTCNTV